MALPLNEEIWKRLIGSPVCMSKVSEAKKILMNQRSGIGWHLISIVKARNGEMPMRRIHCRICISAGMEFKEIMPKQINGVAELPIRMMPVLNLHLELITSLEKVWQRIM